MLATEVEKSYHGSRLVQIDLIRLQFRLLLRLVRILLTLGLVSQKKRLFEFA